MIPNHHPYPETLMSYGAGTLPSTIACVVTCHLSMCSECTQQIRWLEMVGGILLSNLETELTESSLVERPVGQSLGDRQSGERDYKSVTIIDDPLLPLPLARYLSVNGAPSSWQPIGKGKWKRSIKLPNDSGSIKLLRLSPGLHLPEHSSPLETKLALVLDGECSDSAETYACGDIIEWAENPPHRLLVCGDGECVCLMVDHSADQA